jgi:hypothetical protein
MKKIFLLFFFILFFIIFINLGNFVDITQKPIKADIIVSLGGGSSNFRIKKALELYKKGFSRSKKIIYTGGIKEYYKTWGDYLEKNGIPKQNIIYIDRSIAYNTMEEVSFIKLYMLKYHLKSVIFVSDPQHSRRITFLANNIAGYKDAKLDLIVTSAEQKQWDKEVYYKSILSIKNTMIEIIKLFYNFLKYHTPLIQYTQYHKKMEHGTWDMIVDQL